MNTGTRGQTTLDFTIGVTIFLIVLTGVFLFVPGTLEPFEEGNQEDIVTVNRVADRLVEHSLVEPATPYVLDDDCTVKFFDGTSPTPGCDYNGSTPEQQVGIRGFQSVNVTIRNTTSGDGEIYAWNASKDPGERLENASNSSGVTLAEGDSAVGSQSSVTSRRVVELDGQDVFLVVTVW